MSLHYNTVTPLLKNSLEKLMSEVSFTPFRLVGGTNLSLRYEPITVEARKRKAR